MELVNMKQSFKSSASFNMADLFFREKNNLLIADVHVSSVKKAGTQMRIPISFPVSKICLFIGGNFIFYFVGVRTHAACSFSLASKMYLWTLSELSDLTTRATYVVSTSREMGVKRLLFLLWLRIIKQSPSVRFFLNDFIELQSCRTLSK